MVLMATRDRLGWSGVAEGKQLVVEPIFEIKPRVGSLLALLLFASLLALALGDHVVLEGLKLATF